MDQEKEAAFRRIIATDFPAMQGGAELIAALHQAGFGVAVGSSAPSENVKMAIDRLGVRDWLAAVVTGSDVRHGKPDPQIFLVAAERLDVPPPWCVVIEDAPVGIAAAAAAGMACVGLASTGRTREALGKADLVVDSLAELSPEMLRRIIRVGINTNPCCSPSPAATDRGPRGPTSRAFRHSRTELMKNNSSQSGSISSGTRARGSCPRPAIGRDKSRGAGRKIPAASTSHRRSAPRGCLARSPSPRPVDCRAARRRPRGNRPPPRRRPRGGLSCDRGRRRPRRSARRPVPAGPVRETPPRGSARPHK